MLHWIVLSVAALLFPFWGAPGGWRRWALLAAGSYAVTLMLAPTMLERVAGVESCVSRKVLWQNALHLSAQNRDQPTDTVVGLADLLRLVHLDGQIGKKVQCGGRQVQHSPRVFLSSELVCHPIR